MDSNVSSSACGAFDYIARLTEHLSSLFENSADAHTPLSVESLVHIASAVCDYIDKNNLPVPVPTEILTNGGMNAIDNDGNTLSSTHPSCFRSLVLINEALNSRYKGVLAAFTSLVNDLIGCRDDFHGISASKVKFTLFPKLLWQEIYREQIMTEVQKIIDAKVSEECSQEYLEHKLPEMMEWLDGEILPLTDVLFASARALMKNRVRKLMHLSFATLRGNELFDIVAEFPDSYPGVVELKETATASNSINEIARRFRAEVECRLLHIGASTSQILDMYISMVRVLRILDNSDLILDYITQPVKKYLHKRKDTVRKIVSSLTDSKDSELYGELRKGGSLEYGADSDDEDGGPGKDWMPKKRNEELVVSRVPSGQDVLAMLVSIYGSTDLFVAEYRSILAEKLFANVSYYSDAEVATLELLKIRFGEESLHNCEVMLRDLEDSKRVNNATASHLEKNKPQDDEETNTKHEVRVDCLLVSDYYWPPLQTDHFKHHEMAQKYIDEYENAYAELKKPRKLENAPQLGIVDLDLDFDDGTTRTFSVTPVQATLIMHLSDSGKMRLSDLSIACELDEEEIDQKMSYWVAKGVIRKETIVDDIGMSSDYYEVIETQTTNAARDLDEDDEEDEEFADDMTVDPELQDKEALASMEKYIMGLLTNQDNMTVERIHSMLKMLYSGSSDDVMTRLGMNIVSLSKFLGTMVEAEKIDFVDNVYRKHVNR